MFETADPAVFNWCVKTYGPEMNLFVDHSQTVQLKCLRAGIWGTNDTWGRIHCYLSGGERVARSCSFLSRTTARDHARRPAPRAEVFVALDAARKT
jgi:hypothetical protein